MRTMMLTGKFARLPWRQAVWHGVALALVALAFGAGYAVAAQLHMQAARRALQNAEGQLQQAAPDKGGHRVQAMQLVSEAIGEVQAGIAAGAH